MENEDRLINIRQFKQMLEGHRSAYMHKSDILATLSRFPTAEVEHGCWIDSYSVNRMGRIVNHSVYCSVCESVFKDDSREVVQHWKKEFKVCPFCGAKMDGVDEDG